MQSWQSLLFGGLPRAGHGRGCFLPRARFPFHARELFTDTDISLSNASCDFIGNFSCSGSCCQFV